LTSSDPPGPFEPLTPLAPDAPSGSPPSSRPGASTFTIEGRSTPALFVVGWLATLLGLGLLFVAVASGGGIASTALVVLALLLLSVGLIAAAGSQGAERRVRAALPYVGPSPFLVFGASVPVSVLAVIAVAVPLSLLGVPLDGPFAALLSVTVQALVYVALVRLLVVDTGALGWGEMGVRPPDRAAIGEIVGGAVWAIPVIAVTIPISAILLALFPVTPVSPLPPTGEAIGFALSLLAGVIVAPFGEEILFRAFATTAWARGLGARRGLLRAALVFAFAHVLTITGANANEAVGLAIVGFATRIPVALALGWLFLKRGTIWASFGLHAAFNAILLIVAEVASRAV
jgi:membrane protease YdiL (CAAX protease family)